MEFKKPKQKKKKIRAKKSVNSWNKCSKNREKKMMQNWRKNK